MQENRIMIGRPTVLRTEGRRVLDSRGTPTVAARVWLTDGSYAEASVPSGASTGIYEAHEKRDGDPERYGGRDVTSAIDAIDGEISDRLAGMDASDMREIDRALAELDGERGFSRLGANAALAVSLATARAAAGFYRLPLWQYLGGRLARRLPCPMFNILNGGAHAGNNLDIQEFMICPVGAESFSEALRIGSEIYKTLGELLRFRKYSTAVGDEGGYAPDLGSEEEALELICEAIEASGQTTDRVKIALDAAAGEWYDEEGGIYMLPKSGRHLTPAELIAYWEGLTAKYPIFSLEDGLDQRDFEGWAELTERIGGRVMLVGDDLFVTNPERVSRGISLGAANAVLIKPNQIGTLSLTAEVIETAREGGYRYVMSHRSGETEDTTLADLSVAFGAPYIKSGAPCRSERLAKYNRLCEIEYDLSPGWKYGTSQCSALQYTMHNA